PWFTVLVVAWVLCGLGVAAWLLYWKHSQYVNHREEALGVWCKERALMLQQLVLTHVGQLQDRVCAFAGMSPIQLLEETQRAVGADAITRGAVRQAAAGECAGGGGEGATQGGHSQGGASMGLAGASTGLAGAWGMEVRGAWRCVGHAGAWGIQELCLEEGGRDEGQVRASAGCRGGRTGVSSRCVAEEIELTLKAEEDVACAEALHQLAVVVAFGGAEEGDAGDILMAVAAHPSFASPLASHWSSSSLCHPPTAPPYPHMLACMAPELAPAADTGQAGRGAAGGDAARGGEMQHVVVRCSTWWRVHAAAAAVAAKARRRKAAAMVVMGDAGGGTAGDAERGRGGSEEEEVAQEEFDEVAMTLACRILALQQRQPRLLLTPGPQTQRR
ncbi:unnamed protein product, partial [Closterium sp. Naga37s-1]